MGHLLADRFGKAYYAIGTDFYRSCCNLPKNPNRTLSANWKKGFVAIVDLEEFEA